MTASIKTLKIEGRHWKFVTSIMAMIVSLIFVCFAIPVHAEEASAEDLGPESEFISVGIENREYLLTDINGNQISTLAEGKPKILFFFNTGCKRCKAVERTIVANGLNLDEVDFVMAEASEGGLTEEKARAFYKDDEIVRDIESSAKCYGAVETCWDYLRACGFTAEETKKPIIIYISEDNIVQGFSWNYTNIYKNAREAGIQLEILSEKGDHAWKNVQVLEPGIGLVEEYEQCAVCKLEKIHTVQVPNPEKKAFVYNGKKQAVLKNTSAYTVLEGKKTDAGMYEAIVKLNDSSNYEWSDGTTDDKEISWSISKASQKPDITTSSKTIKRSLLKNKSQSFTLKVTGAKSEKHFAKVSGSSCMKVSKTTGKVTVKKGTKKGTYRLKVKVTCEETLNYKAGKSAVKIVTIRVK